MRRTNSPSSARRRGGTYRSFQAEHVGFDGTAALGCVLRARLHAALGEHAFGLVINLETELPLELVADPLSALEVSVHRCLRAVLADEETTRCTWSLPFFDRP